MVTCPECQSTETRYSHRRLWERLLSGTSLATVVLLPDHLTALIRFVRLMARMSQYRRSAFAQLPCDKI